MAISSFKRRVRLLFSKKAESTTCPTSSEHRDNQNPSALTTALSLSSVGPQCKSSNRLGYWLAMGPASAKWNDQIGPEVQKLIERNEDFLEEGEHKCRFLGFGLYMVGKDRSSATPAIIFSSTSQRKRLRAQSLLKKSTILESHPNLKIMTMDRMPMFPLGGFDQIAKAGSTSQDNTKAVGALLRFETGRQASMTTLILIGGSWYGLTVSHPRRHLTAEQTDYFNNAYQLGGKLDVEPEDDFEREAFVDVAHITSEGKS